MSKLERENLYRASFPAMSFREAGADSPPMMVGHFAVFDSPTEIDSLREGNFIEKIAKGAFAQSFRPEHRSQIKALFQHGRDPQIGDRPIGDIRELREDDRGAYYEVELFDGIDPLLMSGLRAGVYGASFRFQVMREDVSKNPGESATNPRGIPERTIREANVSEFGAVTWPAYADATAGVRSITDTIHDVDALAYAGAIILDEERMNQSRIFVSRGIPDDERADYSSDQRAAMAKKGEAIPIKNDAGEIVDGSYPIANATDLANAIQAFGRAGNKAEVKAHIMKRARALGQTSMIPDSWKTGMNSAEAAGELRSLIRQARAMTDAEPAVMLDGDTVEALGSLIEVCESSLEAMESLLGIDDDTTPDEDDTQMNSAAPVGDIRSDAVDSAEQDAPPDGAAASLPHPIRGRSDKQAKSYLRKESPSWQL